MTKLADRLKAEIEVAGPIPVSDFMLRCLLDPADGYYTNRQPFGATGDFVTAPEVSQMFGELVGAWVLTVAASLPAGPVRLVELGPGRGTLMKDVLRTLASLDRNRDRWSVSLVEASPKLAEAQRAALSGSTFSQTWHDPLAEVPAGPAIILGNEIFDALPTRQLVRSNARWCERFVGLDETGALAFLAGPPQAAPQSMPSEVDLPDGTIFEFSPAREALMAEVASRLRDDGGAALFFDYGHLRSGFGDTLQAVRAHAYEDVFASPGEADLTSHVDFAVLARIAATHGLESRTTTQGDFLLALGLLERAGRLGANASAQARTKIEAAANRLAGPDQMGTLFKVLGIASHGVTLPGFALAGPRTD